MLYRHFRFVNERLNDQANFWPEGVVERLGEKDRLASYFWFYENKFEKSAYWPLYQTIQA